MLLIGHETVDQVKQSGEVLAGLGGHARKLMAECVEATGVTRKQLSLAAKSLESAGFLFVRETGDTWAPQFELTPSLRGEEALQVLDGDYDKLETSECSRE